MIHLSITMRQRRQFCLWLNSKNVLIGVKDFWSIQNGWDGRKKSPDLLNQHNWVDNGKSMPVEVWQRATFCNRWAKPASLSRFQSFSHSDLEIPVRRHVLIQFRNVFFGWQTQNIAPARRWYFSLIKCNFTKKIAVSEIWHAYISRNGYNRNKCFCHPTGGCITAILWYVTRGPSTPDFTIKSKAYSWKWKVQ